MTNPTATTTTLASAPSSARAADGEVPWWRRAVVYQIYPRSYADSDGDGIGDVRGIESKLSYLQQLGVDAIWISPWYPSPMKDGGYDVADYRDIDPRFGTLPDAEQLFASAHAHGIRVIVDLVPNHTSSEHAWFKAALEAGRGSPERDRYIFREGKGSDGSQPPNNWLSVFGGPAWRRVADGQWYLHLFDPSQPDLNWENEEVRAEFDSIFRFWLDRGVDGFRVDVAHGLAKAPDLPDVKGDQSKLETHRQPRHPFWDRDAVHDIIRRWRRLLDGCGRDVMMVAEAWVRPERLPLYVRKDEYHQSFNFDFLDATWEIGEIREKIDEALTFAVGVGSTSTWTLSNHDVMRHATRYGLPPGAMWREWPLSAPPDVLRAELDADLGLRKARAATLTLLALPGSTYIYQGEELGLPEVWDLPEEVLDDPVWENSGHTQRGRDGCRVPIPWERSGPSYGFGAGEGWLPQPEVYGQLSVEAQTGVAGSTLELYRHALALRRRHMVADESLEWIDVDDARADHVLAFRRGSGVECYVNFGDNPAPLPDGELLVASDEAPGGQLAPHAAAWVLPAS